MPMLGEGLGLSGRRKDGTEFPVEVMLSLIETDGEHPIIFAVLRGNSKRKGAEDALRESEGRLRAILDNSPTLIFLKDVDGRYLLVNAEFQRVFHMGEEQIKGKKDDEVFPADQAGAFRKNDLLVLEGGASMEFEEVALHDDGPHTSIVHRFPLRNSEGKIYATGGVVTDITDRKRADESLKKALEEIKALKDQLAQEKHYLEEEIRTDRGFEEIIGQSDALHAVLRQIQQVAPTDSSVLIQGETGTGKERIARAIHTLSPRRERTLITLNCAAIPLGLLESELFGHEKGAFTGAIARKVGRFELADQGTLFLDEIGDIPLELQPKLLRVLQEQEFERLGSTRTQRVDVRVVASTNRDLAQMVAERQFRSDLFYRLSVFPIRLPPLRERAEDVPLLVRHFTSMYARRMKKRIEAIPADVMESLVRYSWPGNVRELQNFIERAVILSPGPVLQPPLAELTGPPRSPLAEVHTLEDAERAHILRALEEAHWVIGGPKGAAARLGLKRTTLRYKMERLGIPGRPR